MPKCLGTKWTDACGELAASISQTTSTVAELCASEGECREHGPVWGLRALCIRSSDPAAVSAHRPCEENSLSVYMCVKSAWRKLKRQIGIFSVI